MAVKRRAAVAAADPRPVRELVEQAMAALDRRKTKRDQDNLHRFGINATKAIGVSMSNIQAIAKTLGGRGSNHALAEALWDTGWYEARMLACFVDNPAQVTPAQMNRWCRDFDNWGICDTACFVLFDRTPHAWAKVNEWSTCKEECQKRAAFALIACLGVHDKQASDERFTQAIALVEQAAGDDRHLVQKALSWALRVTGRRNAALNSAAIAVAQRMAESESAPARATGKEVLRELKSALVKRKLAKSPKASKQKSAK